MPQAGVDEDSSDSIIPKICDSLDDLASVVAGSYELVEKWHYCFANHGTKERTTRALPSLAIDCQQ